MKGHLADLSALTFKDGDQLKLAFHAETTDKILVLHHRRQSFTRSTPTSCRAGAAMASRCA